MITGFNLGQGKLHDTTRAFIDILSACGGKIGTRRAFGLDRLIRDLKGETNGAYTTYDLWSSGKMSAIYPMIGGTADCHKWNLLDLQDTDAAFRLTFTGSPAHDERGMDGISTPFASADTHINASTDLPQNDQHLSAFSQVHNALPSGAIGTTWGLESSGLLLWGATSQMYGYINQIGATHSPASAYSSKRGFFLAQRPDAANMEYVYDGIVDSGANATTTAPNRTYRIGVFHNDYNNYVCAFASLGLSLTHNEALFLSNAVTAYNNHIRP